MIGVVKMINDVEATVVGKVANAPVFCFFVVVFGIIVTLLDCIKDVVDVPLLVVVCDVVFDGDDVVGRRDLVCSGVVVGISGANVVVVFVVGKGGDFVVGGIIFVVVGIGGGNLVVVVVVGNAVVVVVVVVGGVLFVVVGVVTDVVVFVDEVVVGIVLLIVVFFVVLVVVGGFVFKVVVRGDAIKFVMTWFNS